MSGTNSVRNTCCMNVIVYALKKASLSAYRLQHLSLCSALAPSPYCIHARRFDDQIQPAAIEPVATDHCSCREKDQQAFAELESWALIGVFSVSCYTDIP